MKKKLLYISSYWPQRLGPTTARFEPDQVEALARQGYQVDVMVPRPLWRPSIIPKDAKHLGINYQSVRVKSWIQWRLPNAFHRIHLALRLSLWLASTSLVRSLKEEFEEKKYKAIILSGELYIGLSPTNWSRLGIERSVMIIHGEDPLLSKMRKSVRAKISSSAVNQHQIAIVGRSLSVYVNGMGLCRAVHVIHNGVKATYRGVNLNKFEFEKIKIITCARLIQSKGVDDLITALHMLARNAGLPVWSLDVIGDGPEMENLKNLAADTDVADQIIFRGTLPNENVLDLMSDAHLFVLPSWKEAFGIVYLEAMSVGCVVIGCEDTGAADIISDGIDGYMVPQRSPQVLSQVVLNIFNKPRSDLMKIAENGVSRSREFTWDRNASKLLEVLYG